MGETCLSLVWISSVFPVDISFPHQTENGRTYLFCFFLFFLSFLSPFHQIRIANSSQRHRDKIQNERKWGWKSLSPSHARSLAPSKEAAFRAAHPVPVHHSFPGTSGADRPEPSSLANPPELRSAANPGPTSPAHPWPSCSGSFSLLPPSATTAHLSCLINSID